MKPVVMVKLGGSFLTDKNRPAALHEDRARRAGAELAAARRQAHDLPLLVGHGAGSFGHIIAREYRAVDGVHPEAGWRAFHRLRRSMAALTLRLLELWAEEGFEPAAVQPSAAALARDGRLVRFDTAVIEALLGAGQVPLVHGDVVVDERRGFTIVSTESQFAWLAGRLPVARVLMVTDVAGVLDEAGRTIPRITAAGAAGLTLGGCAGADVTGGMRHKIDAVQAILAGQPGAAGRIVSGLQPAGGLCRAVLGQSDAGTEIAGPGPAAAASGAAS